MRSLRGCLCRNHMKEQTMSNQEAIEALKRIRDEATENFIGEWSDYEAFDIAIKALKGADDE